MTSWILATALMALAFLPSSATAQSKDTLVGTWKLVDATDTTEKGEVIEHSYGQNPTGFLTYTPDGRMMVIVTFGGRKPFSAVPAPVQETAEAFFTFFAYAGRYTLSGDRVTHHIEAAWRQDWANTDQIRFIVKLEANRMTLRTPPLVLSNGVRLAKEELVWERVKPDANGG
jgi:Lipocalin-like domain